MVASPCVYSPTGSPCCQVTALLKLLTTDQYTKLSYFGRTAVSDDAAPTSGASDFLYVFLQPRCQDGLFGDNDGVQNEDWVMEPWLDGAVYISVLNDRCLSPVYHLMEKVTEKPTDVKCTAKKSCLDPEVRPVYQWMSLQAQL